jgi:hypothetical protein
MLWLEEHFRIAPVFLLQRAPRTEFWKHLLTCVFRSVNYDGSVVCSVACSKRHMIV